MVVATNLRAEPTSWAAAERGKTDATLVERKNLTNGSTVLGVTGPVDQPGWAWLPGAGFWPEVATVREFLDTSYRYPLSVNG